MTDTFKSILLADDEPTLREMYGERMKNEGFNIAMAKDGEEALSKAKDLKPNIILLDIMMPKMNGLDVLQQLKADPETANIPVIVLTALIQDQERLEAMKRGAVDFIVKSESMPGDVIAKIKNVLDGPNNQSVPANPQAA